MYVLQPPCQVRNLPEIREILRSELQKEPRIVSFLRQVEGEIVNPI